MSVSHDPAALQNAANSVGTPPPPAAGAAPALAAAAGAGAAGQSPPPPATAPPAPSGPSMQQFDELQNRFKTLDAKYAEADAFRSKIMGAVAPDAEDKADPKAYLGVAEEALREANIVHLAASQRVRFPGDLAAVLSRDPAYAVDLKTRRLKDPVAAESAMTAFLATPRGKQWVEAPVATPPAPPAPTGTAPTPGQVPPVPPPAGNANGTPPPPAAADPNAAPAKRTFKNIIFKKP